MGKLHEVLAVETGLKATTDSILAEAIDTFSKKQGHFDGHVKHYEKLREDSLDYSPEQKEMVTTVQDKLEYVFEHLSRSLDATFQKEKTNQLAQADILIGDITIAKTVPATFLLTLESKLNELRTAFLSIPTLDPSKVWNRDSERKNIYVSKETETLKTEKVVEPIVLYAATKEHPAQTQLVSLDKTIGKWKTKHFSGALTQAEKSDLLGRVDKLLRAVKQARMRANDQEVTATGISENLISYLKG